NGITIEYYRGRPLGELMVAVLPENLGTAGPLQPIPVGAGKEVIFEQAGTLLFKVNESPVWLEDNQGQLEIRVRSAGSSR
ncbi:MAG: hypothetical protein ACKO81_01500, partial [Planctomycetota bacterium]